MPQVSNLRLFFPANSFHSFAAPILVPGGIPFARCFPVFLPSYLKRRKPHFFSTISCSYSRKPKPNFDSKGNSQFSNRRRSIVTEGGIEKDKVADLAMEEGNKRKIETGEDVGFNRKRAEGRDAPKKNLALKVRKLNPINTISYVQILGTGMDTQDTSPSVLLFFDKQRFIFNAGEGLQRFCNEHKIKLSKIDHIFLSRVCSETAGGLPGLLLTLAGIGEEGMAVNLWGPMDLKYFVEAMRSFIPNAAMVHTHSFGPTSSNSGSPSRSPKNHHAPLVLVDDEVVKISALLLEPSRIAAPGSVESGVDVGKLGDVSVVYICELPEVKGKFDLQKAKDLGLKPGPKYRELQLGNSVKSDRDGAMVHPHDVLAPSSPGPIVLLIDCPTESHFCNLLSRESLNPYYIDTAYEVPEGSKVVNCVVHLTPASVAQMDEYRIWMSKFAAAQHIMAGHEMKNVEIPILKASARIGARLNYLCPQLFPSSGIWSLESLNIMPNQVKSMKQNVLRKGAESSAENLLKFHLRPSASLGIDASCVPSKSSTLEIIDELLSEIPEIKDASQRAAKFWSRYQQGIPGETMALDAERIVNEEPWLHDVEKPSCLENISREDMEIVLLGTGSSQPSKHRNVSSVLINLFSKGSIILDCGEGTLGQLKRRFGIKGADDIIRSLKCIWISHIHADHHTGLARILALRRDLLNETLHEPLVVVGPRQLKRYLDAYQRLENLDMQFLDCGLTTETALANFSSYDENSTLFAKGSRMQSISLRSHDLVMPIFSSLKKSLREAGLEALISFPVVHCPQSFGVILQAENRMSGDGKAIPGWKVVYSGDTRPCPETVKASRGATVLIHEATFEDGLMDEAVARNHSTTKEAVEVGDSAGAYRIILTHFSQRYPKIPVFDEAHMHKTCIGFDLMSVNLADIHILPRLLPYLKLLFKNETEDVNSETAALV